VRVAYLHGFAGDPAAWDATLAALPRHDARAIALPGHGGGPVLASWDACLAAIAGAIGEVDLVVGYSLGARAALGLLATGRATRAILVSVNPGLDDEDRPARRASDAAWARLLRERGSGIGRGSERGIEAFADAWEAQPLFATQARTPPGLLAARRARRRALDPEQLARSLEVMGLAEMPDYRPALRLAAPRAALIAGADDPKYLALARATAAPLAVIAGSGHDPTLEQPEALADAIAAAAGLAAP
jgi:2-succinyl-6-hydroxy-2,4-cyclohexadiene-1-carboxylate synthase